jgi:hypothetical protein
MWNRIYHGILRKVSALKLIPKAGTRAQIRIETESVFILRRRNSSRGWCQQCARHVEMIQSQDAAALTSALQRTLRNFSGTERWHVSYAPGGSLLICVESVLNSLCKSP